MIHLVGAHTSEIHLLLEGVTDNLAEVTCEACREHIRTIGAAYSGGKRNRTIPWLVERDSHPLGQRSSAPARVNERGSHIHTESVARRNAAHVLEEMAPSGGFRRFDLRRWLAQDPGVHTVTLRVRRPHEFRGGR